MEPWNLLFSYLAFTGFLASVVLVVLTWRLGLRSALGRGVFAFGVTYGLWSLGCVFLFTPRGFEPTELACAVASVGMFSFPVSGLAITLALGKWPRAVKRATAWVIGSGAVLVTLWSVARHRFYPGLSAFALDNRPLDALDPLVPWLVFALNGVGFAIGALGLLRVRRNLGSGRLGRQVTLVLIQLAAGLGTYVATSLAEVIWQLPPAGMVTLLYPLALNFHLIWKYRYLRFDLPTLGPEIIDALGEAVFLLDPQGRILKANPAARRIFHRRLGEASGEAFRGLFDDPSAVDQAWTQVLASRAAGEFPGLRLAPHYDVYGDLVGLVAIVDRSDAFEVAASRFGLTPRERDVAQLLVQGLSVREMAEASFVSQATIKTHLVHLYQKSGATNRVSFLQKILQNR